MEAFWKMVKDLRYQKNGFKDCCSKKPEKTQWELKKNANRKTFRQKSLRKKNRLELKKLSLSVSKKTRLELKKKSNATKRDRIRRSLITYEVIPEWFWHECSAVVCRGRCVFMVEYTDITHELIH